LRDDAPDFVDKRPDKDNYEKFVLDALNGIYWTDDSVIVTGRTTKYYSEIPGIVIKIKKLTRKE
jgi:Holliday junction resolvase RusA-like endonuclease